MKKLTIVVCFILFSINYLGAEDMTNNDTAIEIIIGSQKAEGIIYDNIAGRSFLEMLPLNIKMSDYNKTEKIGKVGKNININGLPSSFDPDISDIAYYKPFGNLCFFYRDFGLSYGLYSIGKITKGIDIFANQKNDFEITIKKK